MYEVYILYSFKDGKLYVGCTSNLKQRLKRHNSGSVRATRHRRPLEVIHSEQFTDKSKAFTRERFLKSLWSARFKRKLVKEYVRAKSIRKAN